MQSTAPDFFGIRDHHKRWLAFREGPFAADCAETIWSEAHERAKKLNGWRTLSGGRIKLYKDCPEASPEHRQWRYNSDLAHAALDLIDALNGDGDSDIADARDAFEELLERGA